MHLALCILLKEPRCPMDRRGYNSVESHIVHQANLDIVTIESGIRTGFYYYVHVHKFYLRFTVGYVYLRQEFASPKTKK